MANTEFTLQADGLFWHAAPEKGGATRIAKGKLRKGKYGNNECMGIIWFKADAVRAIVANRSVKAAKLILTRAPGTDTGSRAVCVTQYQYNDINTTDSYTHEQVYVRTYKSAYLTTVSGETSEIPIPGGMLRRIKEMGKYNFVVYHGPEEEGDEYVEFTGATLKLTCGTDWVQPVWNRPINKGDLVCTEDRERSHRVDLYELRYYLNQRAVIDSLDVLDPSYGTMIEGGLYKNWATIIQAMVGKLQACLTAEGKDYTIPVVPTAGDMPNAAIINWLRNYLGESPAGAGTSMTVDNVGRAYYTTHDGFHERNGSWTLDWRAGEGPLSGKVWGWINQKTAKEYSHRFGFWFLPVPEGVVTSLKLRLTTVKGQDRSSEDNKIRLYPIVVSSLPSGNSSTTIGEVVDFSEPAGEATSAGVHRTAPGNYVETLDVTLSADFITALKNGDCYGVAAECDQVIREYEKTATLLVNGGGE